MENSNIMLITESNNSTDIEMLNQNYQNCTNDYCISDEDYIAMIADHVFPDPLEWASIAVYVITFIIGVVGNSLVCVSVWKNQTLQTVTNTFIVNLAAANLAVIVVCLPPTLLVDVSETWFMGLAMCKVTLFLMNVMVTVSVLTLCAIAVERWYRLCKAPRVETTLIRAKLLIVIIWLMAGCIAMPELVVGKLFHTVPEHLTLLLTVCRPGWEYHSQTTYQIFLIVALYVLPLWLMTSMYLRIAAVVWSNYVGTNKQNVGVAISMNKTATGDKMRFRKKVAIMLMTVVACFAICYLPVHLLNILRYAGVLQRVDGKVISNVALVCHWLPYLNSAINPIIYGIMSAQFRSQFKRTCRCLLERFSDDVSEVNVIEVNPHENHQHLREIPETQNVTIEMAETKLA